MKETLLPVAGSFKDNKPADRPGRGQTWNSHMREIHRPGVVYLWPKGETIWDNLMNRRTRPYNLYKEQLLPVVRSLLGQPDLEFKWSQKAGCSCGCSPGFIITGGKESWKLKGHDIHLSFTM